MEFKNPVVTTFFIAIPTGIQIVQKRRSVFVQNVESIKIVKKLQKKYLQYIPTGI